MEDREIINKYIPPRAIDSIAAGFHVASKNLQLVLFPVFLDLFLWLGPKLQVKSLFLDLFQNFINIWSAYLTDTTNSVLTLNFKQSLEAFLNSFNLFTVSATFPVGIPSLMASSGSLFTPFGSARLVDVHSFLNFFFLLLILTIIGIFAGALYFHELAITTQIEINNNLEARGKKRFFMQLIHSGIYMLILTTIVFILFFTLVFFASIISLASPQIAQFLLMLGFVFSGWLLIPMLFGAHSIFLYNESIYKSLLSGYRVMSLSFRYPVSQKEALFTLPKSVSFLFLVYIMYQGLNLVWRIPDSNSWLMLVGILGHSFICTALFLSSFHYFSEVNAWQHTLKTAQQQVSVFNENK